MGQALTERDIEAVVREVTDEPLLILAFRHAILEWHSRQLGQRAKASE